MNLPQATLSETVRVLNSIKPAHSQLPILGRTLIKPETNPTRLTLTATNLDITVTATLSLDGRELIPPTCVETKRLGQLVGAMTSPDVELTPDKSKGNGDRLIIQGGSARFTLATMPAEEFPPLPAPGTIKLHLPAAELQRILKRCGFAVSDDESRYVLNSACFEWKHEKGLLHIITTDVRRLSHDAIERPAGCDDPAWGKDLSIVIPAPVLPILQSANVEGDSILLQLPEIKPGQDNHTQASFTWVTMAGGERVNITLTTKLIDGQYPNWRIVVPPGRDRMVRIPGEEFAGAIRRLIYMIGDKTEAMKWAVDTNQMTLSVLTPEIGHGIEHIPLASGFAKGEATYNIEYLRDYLPVVGTVEDGVLTWETDPTDIPATPAVFRIVHADPAKPSPAPHWFSVLMPMRTN